MIHRTIDNVFDASKVPDHYKEAFKKHVGDHVSPHVEVDLVSVQEHDVDRVKRQGTGHGEFRETVIEAREVTMFVMFKVHENTRTERYVALGKFEYDPEETSEYELTDLALQSLEERTLGSEIKTNA